MDSIAVLFIGMGLFSLLLGFDASSGEPRRSVLGFTAGLFFSGLSILAVYHLRLV